MVYFPEPMDDQKKRKRSYLGRIPSIDFWDEAYQLFLEFASPEELEDDILTREHWMKLVKYLDLIKTHIQRSHLIIHYNLIHKQFL